MPTPAAHWKTTDPPRYRPRTGAPRRRDGAPADVAGCGCCLMTMFLLVLAFAVAVLLFHHLMWG